MIPSAHRWNGENWNAIAEWIRRWNGGGKNEVGGYPDGAVLRLGGIGAGKSPKQKQLAVKVGDWIIRDENGLFICASESPAVSDDAISDANAKMIARRDAEHAELAAVRRREQIAAVVPAVVNGILATPEVMTEFGDLFNSLLHERRAESQKRLVGFAFEIAEAIVTRSEG